MRKRLLKPVALVLAVSFLNTQVLWAGDFWSSFFEDWNDSQRRLAPWIYVIADPIPPQLIQALQNRQENAAQHQTDLLDLQKLNFTLTTSSDDLLRYVGGALSRVERPDGTVLGDLALDEAGLIQSAHFEVQVFQNGEVLSQEVPDGTKVFYTQGRVDYTLSKTGIRSTYHYDSSTQILLFVDSDDFRADYYPDGSLKEFWSKPDQKRSFYEGGLLTRILTSEGAEYFYEAVKTPQGDTQVTLSSFKTPGGLLYTLGPRTISHVSPEAVTEYDLNGTLLGTRTPDRKTFYDFYTTGDFKGWVSRVGYPGGFEEITYSKDSNGEIRHQRYRRVLKRKRFLSGSRAYWIRKLVGEGKGAWSIPTPPAPDLSTLPDLRRIVYSPDRSPREVWKADGSKLTFEEGSSSDFPGLGGVSVFQNNLDARYDATGRLTQVQVGDLTFHYRKDAPGIDFILKEDGTRLSDLTFENGTLTGARIQSPDGEERTYAGGRLAKLLKPDSTELAFGDVDPGDDLTDWKPLSLKTPEGLSYHFSYTPQTIEAELDPHLIPTAPDTAMRRLEYDRDFRLKKAVRQDNQILGYLNCRLDFILPSETPDQKESFTYFEDGGYRVQKGETTTFYDKENRPVKSLVQGPQRELEVRYRDGRIQEIAQDSVPVFAYSYSFDPDHRELTTIEDLKTNSVKVYQRGLLLSSTDYKTRTESLYSYNQKGEISEVLVKRLGRELHRYTYAYEGEGAQKRILVTDEEGTKRTYGRALLVTHTFKETPVWKDTAKTEVLFHAWEEGEEFPPMTEPLDHKLLFLERDGLTFAYSYSRNRKISMAYEKSVSGEIVKESLLRKTLKNGAYATYQDGRIETVTLSNGLVVSGVRLDASRNLDRASVALRDQSQRVFGPSEILGVLDPDGRHFYYSGGKLQKVEDPVLGDLEYLYDKDPSGELASIWVRRRGVRLEYSPQGELRGARPDTFLPPGGIKLEVTYSAAGGQNSEYSFDTYQGAQDFDTAQTGGIGALYSEHSFPSPQTITELSYRLEAYASANGSTDKGSWATVGLQTKDATTGEWRSVPQAYRRNGSDSGPNGNSTEGRSATANPEIIAVNLPNVIAVRAYAVANAFANQGGSTGGFTAIYGLDYALADLSYLSFDGASFTGTRGTRTFSDLNLNSNYARLPHPEALTVTSPADLGDWQAAAKEAILDADVVAAQEYSSEGLLETQTKADQSVTLYNDSHQPSQVLDETGQTLMEYSYDYLGNLSGILLKKAREVLPQEIAQAGQEIQTQKARALYELATVRDDQVEHIKGVAETNRSLLARYIQILESHRAGVAGAKVQGKEARAMQADALNAFDRYLGQYRTQITLVSSQEAEAYLGLDRQFEEEAQAVQLAADQALEALEEQQKNLEFEILKEEYSPVIYDRYRRTLGRDPSTPEYREWIERLDYGSGVQNDPRTGELAPAPIQTKDGRQFLGMLEETLQNSPELPERRAYVDAVKDRVIARINAYWSLTDPFQRTRFISDELGLDQTQVVHPDALELRAIIRLIEEKSQSLHFGQSAFLALEALLESANAQNPSSPNSFIGDQNGRIELASQAILIDIFSGILTPLDEGDLVISMFALNQVARRYGLSLSGASLSWEGLRQIYDSNKPLIEEVLETTYLPGSSISFGGTGDPGGDDDNLSVDSRNLGFGGGDFTIESWARLDSLGQNQMIFSRNRGEGAGSFELNYNPSQEILLWNESGSVFKKEAWSPQPGRWYHLAVVRTQDLIHFYVDGVELGSASPGSRDLTGDYPLHIGSDPAGNWGMNGRLDGVRISDQARYTRNFTPSTERFKSDESTRLLLYATPEGIKDLSGFSQAVTLNRGTRADASAFAQSVPQTAAKKVITRYPSSIRDPGALTDAQKEEILNHPDSYNPRVIAHISGNHYVVITAITEDSITYIDPGIGKDKENESLTVAKEGFLKVWKGNVTGEDALVRSVIPAQAGINPTPASARVTSRILSVQETQSLRGAFWGSLLGLLGSILVWIPGLNGLGLALSAVSAMVSGIEGDWLSAISSIVTLGIAPNGLGGFFSDVFKGVTSALGGLGTVFNAVGGFIGNVYNAVTGFSKTLVSGLGGFFHGALGVSSKAAADIARTAVGVGLNFGVSRGLESLGVSPQIAGFLGSLTAGAVIGGSKGNTQDFINGHVVLTSVQQNIQASMTQVLTLTNVGRLGLELGLDSSFTNLIGLSLGAVQGSLLTSPGTTLEKAFSNITPQLFGPLAQYGMEKLGGVLGIDPRVSTLIGTPISGTIGAALQGGASVGANIINAVKDGISRGITSLAIDYAGQALNLSPFFTGLTARAVMGALEGLLETPGNRVQGLFEGLFEGITQSGINALTFDQNGPVQGDVNLSLQRTLYLQRILKFSDIIKKDGIEAAIENHVTEILQRDAVESVFKQGGIASLIAGNSKPVLDAQGNTVAIEVKIQDDVKIYLNPTSDNVVGRDIAT